MELKQVSPLVARTFVKSLSERVNVLADQAEHAKTAVDVPGVLFQQAFDDAQKAQLDADIASASGPSGT